MTVLTAKVKNPLYVQKKQKKKEYQGGVDRVAGKRGSTEKGQGASMIGAKKRD